MTRSRLTELVRIALPIGILTFGVLAYAAITGRRETPPRVERTIVAPLVETIPVVEHRGDLDLDVDGVVVPHREINLSAEVRGRVTFKAPVCRAGRYVTRGTLLVEIDPRTYQLEVERLGEEVKQADATLAELDVEIQNTANLIDLAEEEVVLRERDVQRKVSLFQQKAASESDLDAMRRAELTARNALVALNNQTRMLESRRTRLESARDLSKTRLEQAKIDLEKSQIRAPIDGVVVTESVEQDDFVQQGTGLCTIEDVSAAEVRCQLRMEELNWIWRQQAPVTEIDDETSPILDYQLPQTPVTISYALGNQVYSWEGILSRFEGIGLDEKTRTVPCRVLVPEPRRAQTRVISSSAIGQGLKALVRGMYVQITIHAHPQVTMLRVPERAVQPGNVVWCVRNGKLNIVPLLHLTLLEDRVLVPEVGDGLHPGDQVVVTPLPGATEGMAVSVAPEKTEIASEAGQP